MTQKRLFVGGLFPQVLESDLKDRFSKFGSISGVEIKIRKDEEGSPIKTFAYIDMETSESDIKKCFTTYNRTKWKGSELKLQVAKENFVSRLEKERTIVEDEKYEVHDDDNVVENRLNDIAGIHNFQMRGAKPGTAVPGEKNWIVGKYGRVLPVVHLKKKGIRNLVKVDPSKLTHNVKRIIPEEGSTSVQSDNLTWQMDETDNEVTRKRKGVFPDWKPKPKPKRKITEKDKEKKSDSENEPDSNEREKRRKRSQDDSDSDMEVVPVSRPLQSNNTPPARSNKTMDLSRFDSDSEPETSNKVPTPNKITKGKKKGLKTEIINSSNHSDSSIKQKGLASLPTKCSQKQGKLSLTNKTKSKEFNGTSVLNANKNIKESIVSGKKTLTGFKGTSFLTEIKSPKANMNRSVSHTNEMVLDSKSDDEENSDNKDGKVGSEDDGSVSSADTDEIVSRMKQKQITSSTLNKTQATSTLQIQSKKMGMLSVTDEFSSGFEMNIDDDSDYSKTDDDGNDEESDFETLAKREVEKRKSLPNSADSFNKNQASRTDSFASIKVIASKKLMNKRTSKTYCSDSSDSEDEDKIAESKQSSSDSDSSDMSDNEEGVAKVQERKQNSSDNDSSDMSDNEEGVAKVQERKQNSSDNDSSDMSDNEEEEDKVAESKQSSSDSDSSDMSDNEEAVAKVQERKQNSSDNDSSDMSDNEEGVAKVQERKQNSSDNDSSDMSDNEEEEDKVAESKQSSSDSDSSDMSDNEEGVAKVQERKQNSSDNDSSDMSDNEEGVAKVQERKQNSSDNDSSDMSDNEEEEDKVAESKQSSSDSDSSDMSDNEEGVAKIQERKQNSSDNNSSDMSDNEEGVAKVQERKQNSSDNDSSDMSDNEEEQNKVAKCKQSSSDSDSSDMSDNEEGVAKVEESKQRSSDSSDMSDNEEGVAKVEERKQSSSDSSDMSDNEEKKNRAITILKNNDAIEDDDNDDDESDDEDNGISSGNHSDSSSSDSDFESLVAKEMEKISTPFEKKKVIPADKEMNLEKSKIAIPVCDYQSSDNSESESSDSHDVDNEKVSESTNKTVNISNVTKSNIVNESGSSDTSDSESGDTSDGEEESVSSKKAVKLAGIHKSDSSDSSDSESSNTSVREEPVKNKIVKTAKCNKSEIIDTSESSDNTDSDIDVSESESDKSLNTNKNHVTGKTPKNIAQSDNSKQKIPSPISNANAKVTTESATENKAAKKVSKHEQKNEVLSLKTQLNESNTKFRKVVSKEDAEKSKDVDKKRQEAVKQRQQENLAQKSAVQKALSNLDKSATPNKKIVFDSDSESDDVTKATAIDEASSDSESSADDEAGKQIPKKDIQKKAATLFDSSSDDDSDDDSDDEADSRFDIRPQYEGASGKKLMKLQARFGNDERFKMDKRFVESGSESESESVVVEEEDERTRSLKILQGIVGDKAIAHTGKEEKAKRKFKDVSNLMYDPSKDDHGQFEVKSQPKPEAKQKRKSKKKEEVAAEENTQQADLPEVSKEKFYEISDSIKSVFANKAKEDEQSQAGQTFSLLAAFGRHGDVEADKEPMEDYETSDIPSVLRSNQLSLDNRFKVTDDNSDGGSDNDDEVNLSDDPEHSEQKMDTTETSTSASETTNTPSTFFFLDNDARLKEGEKFYRTEDMDIIRERWSKTRHDLIENYKTKHKNFRRKLRTSQQTNKGRQTPHSRPNHYSKRGGRR